MLLHSMSAAVALIAVAFVIGTVRSPSSQTAEPANYRRPHGDPETRFWLVNMIWYHGFSNAEITAATGMTDAEIAAAVKRFRITPAGRPHRRDGDALTVMPYPGGRHPRIGFLEGAIRPQRETKFSVFAPWDEKSYVVADVPEAFWSNLGLTYLAHTHVPTIWSEKGVTLPPLEWRRRRIGVLEIERRLPNGIVFGAKIVPGVAAVRIELWLHNRTAETLTGLRIQNCVMLRGMAGFDAQTNENKRFEAPFAACRSVDGDRWVITAWERCIHAWGNEQCPCMHSDPKFPDCPPGSTERLHGILTFYQGTDIKAELGGLQAAYGRWLGGDSSDAAASRRRTIPAPTTVKQTANAH